MGRNRISWDMEKAASMSKEADPYTMNQDHKNNPVEKYRTGDPSTWAETPDMKTPWKGEGRTEDGHPAPLKGAREAVVTARNLEEKALKCITIAQRMLPGASDAFIEEQATDLMYLPERSVFATLQRQSELAEVLAKGEKDDEDDADAEAGKKCKDEEDADAEAGKKCKDEEDADAEAGKKAPIVPAPEEKEEVEAKKKKDPVVPAPEEKEEVEAKKKKDPVVPAPEEKEEIEAKKKDPVIPVPEEKEEVEAKKKDLVVPAPEEKEEVEASNGDLLDMIFAQEEPKAGVKKLSGIVKQASTEINLESLWDAPPDVSKAFR